MTLEAARMPIPDPRPPLGAPGSGHLILVDDDELVHVALHRHLRGTDWHLTGFTNPEAALAALEAGPYPDLLFVDLHMPGMNGNAMIEALGPDWRAGPCRTYLCSAVPPPEDVRCQAAAAGTVVLLKNTLFDPAELRVLLDIVARDKADQPAPGEPDAARRNLAGLHPK